MANLHGRVVFPSTLPAGRLEGYAANRSTRGGQTLSPGHLAKLGKHSAVLLVANVLSRGLGWFLVPLYTRYLLPEEFGYWETLILVATLVSLLSAHGITAALMWTLKTGGGGGDDEPDESRKQAVIAAAVGWAMACATVICGTGMAFGSSLANLSTERPEHGLALALLLGGQGLRIVTYPAEGVLKLRFQTLTIVTMSFGEFLVQGVGSVLALAVFDMGLEGMAWANFLGALLRAGVAWVRLPEMRHPRLDWPLVKPMVRYGLPLLPGTISALVLSLSDRRFFIWYDMDAAGGIYAYGDKWARIVEFLLITPLVSMWPAVFFNIAREPDARQQFARIATLFAGVAGSVAFALTMMGPALTRLFDTSTNDGFAGAAGPIGVLTVGYICFGLNEVARVGFQVTGRTRRTAACMVAAALVNLALNAVLIPRWGAQGAAWATLVAYALAVVLTLWLSRTIFPQRWEWGRLAHVTGLFVGCAWAVHLLAPPDDTPQGLGVRVGMAIIAPALLLLTGFLREDERATLSASVARLMRRSPSG